MSNRLALAVVAAWLGSGAVAGAQPPAPPLSWVDLSYPAEALVSRETGVVVVRATTDATGRVTSAESLTGPGTLARATVDNVRQWTLATKAGSDVLVFRFEIEHARCNDDSRSLFQLVHSNLAVITACTGPGRKPLAGTRDWWRLMPRGPAPRYPPLAQSARVTGVVVLEVWIGADGGVTDARALNGTWQWFTDAAVADVKTWRAVATPRPPGANTVLVYEFALHHHPCDNRSVASYEWVSPQYRRLNGCTPMASHD